MGRVQRFLTGLGALSPCAAAGRLVTLALCLFVGLVSLLGLVDHSAALVSHRAVPGVVVACDDGGAHRAACTVRYPEGAPRDVQVDAAAVGAAAGERVHLWVSDDEVFVAGGAFVRGLLLTVGVLGACLVVIGGLVRAISRTGEGWEI